MRTKIVLRTVLFFILIISLYSCKNNSSKENNKLSNAEKENLRKTYYSEFYYLRVSDDKSKFSEEILKEIANQFQIANTHFDSKTAITTLDSLVNNEKYAGANRIGCALLYLGQMCKNNDKEMYLLKAKTEYSNSWFRDGVNVGAYATYKLYFYYKYIGNKDKENECKIELLSKYANYIDHNQHYIKDILFEGNK